MAAPASADGTCLLSIVTVCRNSAATIGETLASVDPVLAGEVRDVEHLVIDGLSTDATVRIVQAHPSEQRRLVSERDTGIYSAMNKGLRLARGEYVWFLNSDDALHPRLAAQWAALLEVLRRQRPSMLVGEVQMFRAVGDATRRTRYWRVPTHLERAKRFGWHPPHPAFIARRQWLVGLGGFDESKRIAADFKLMTQSIHDAAGGMALFPHPMVAMREGGVSNGSIGAILNANRECYRSLRELGQSPGRAGLGICMKLLRKTGQKFVAAPVPDKA